MRDEGDKLMADSVEEGRAATYEPPRLTPIGNLRDLLAGGGSLPCDGGILDPGAEGRSGPEGTPEECGPVG